MFVVLTEGALESLVFISFHRDDDCLLRLYCCQKSSVEEAVEQVEDVDEVIQQVNADHKHVLTDWFVSNRCTEKRPYGAGGAHKHGQKLSMPELDLYQRDRIHLNGAGNVRLRALIEWIVECVTFKKFDGQKRIDGPKGGVALWKF